MCGCFGMFVVCLLFLGVINVKMIDLLLLFDLVDGKMFCVICMYDVCDNLMVLFLFLMVIIDLFVVDIGMFIVIFLWLQINNYYIIMVKQIEELWYGGKLLLLCLVLFMFDDGFCSYYMKVLLLFECFKYLVVMGFVIVWIDILVDMLICISDKVQVLCDYFLLWDEVKKFGQLEFVEFGCYIYNFYYGVIVNL